MRTFFSISFLLLTTASAYAQVQQPVARAAVPVSTTGYLLQGIFGLLVVLGLMWGAWWLVRRTGFNRIMSAVPMKVVGALAIGNRERVMVVEVGDQWLVLGVTATQINTLATLPKQELPEGGSGENATVPFAAWLKKTMDRRDDENKA